MWEALLGPIADVIKAIITDKTQAAAATDALKQMALKGQLDAQLAQIQAITSAQSDINKVEAAQPGVHFRDGAGWVCVANFAVLTLKPLIEWGCTLAGHPVTLPAVDQSTTVPMLFALLGLGTLHVYQTTNK